MLDASVSRKVLSDSADPGVAHSPEKRARECGHDIRFPVEGAPPDHRAHAAIEVEHRREAEVDAARTQLDGHQPSTGTGGEACEARVPIMEIAVRRRRGQRAETVPKALHPPSFVIHSDENRRLFQLVYGVAECAKAARATDSSGRTE